jgi:(4-(4-[2-(gamma-L-glutamylamino)ethyl]phenoxymethyl)furan-2-yl)methanamine synthase
VTPADRPVIGWDIGGAHVKAAWLDDGAVRDAAQWPCPLWQGTAHLDAALALAAARWPALAQARHAVTMTGEMTDLFADREDGVRQLSARLAQALPHPRFFAGDRGWPDAAQAADVWADVASANWLATARHVARALAPQSGVLVDIGSTTTDLIPFADGRVLTDSRSDAQRLARGELVYHGVVRTPLCALARRVPWRGAVLNVMNEFFATTADVYRLTGELDPACDQHPAADNAPKDLPHTQARLARMIGLDARDGSPQDWLAFARAWRAEQLAELRGQLDRVVAMHRLGPRGLLVSAGCGDFLAAALRPAGWALARYAHDVVRLSPWAAPEARAWAQVAAPCVAVAALYTLEETSRCGW